MMRWLFRVALLVVGVAPATAATWTCAERTEIVTTTLVMVRCRATGTYTAGGDPFSNVRVDLCNSASRIPRSAVSSTAASATTGEGYVAILDRATHTVVLLTSNKTAQDYALTEVPGGTSIDGATFMALVECE